MSFTIENSRTRASLRNAFEQLFCKYGHDFKDDDEIDLTDLTIVKRGKHLSRIKTLQFGNSFHRPRKDHGNLELDNTLVDGGEDEDIFVKLSKVSAAGRSGIWSETNNLAKRLIELDEGREKSREKKFKGETHIKKANPSLSIDRSNQLKAFDSIFKFIIFSNEKCELLEACKCKRKDCFECCIFKICIK